MPEDRRLARAAVATTLATIAGYAVTLVQQIAYARALGVGADTDGMAAALAWAVSTTGIIGTTLMAVVIPAYIRARATSPEAASTLFGAATCVATAIGLVLAIGSLVAAPALVQAMLPGSSGEGAQVATDVVRLTAPLHVLWIATVAAIALANSRGRFVLAAASTIIPSVPVIASVVIPPHPSVYLTAAAYVLGVALQLGFLIAYGRDWIRDLAPRLHMASLQPLRRSLVPIGLAFLAINLTGVAIRSVASLGPTGDVATLDYATRLTTAAESVLLNGVLAILLTVWSEDAVGAQDRLPVGRTIAYAIVLGGGAALSLALLAGPIVALLFGGGRFSQLDSARVASVLVWLAVGMAARMVHMVAVRVLLARQARWTIAWIGVIALLGVVGGAAIGHAIWGLDGVAVGYSVGWIGAAAATVAATRRRLPPNEVN